MRCMLGIEKPVNELSMEIYLQIDHGVSISIDRQRPSVKWSLGKVFSSAGLQAGDSTMNHLS
jgi:hypothetical protein